MTLSRLRPFTLLILALLFGAAPTSAQTPPAPLRGIDAYVDAAIEAWEVPGLAFAVVRNDSIVYAKGYGVRRLGGGDAVDANTIFAIGSASKAFTAALLAMLVDEEKAAWDDRVTQHLPWFQVHDPYVTREMRIRDLLSHRSGLTRGDRLWYGTTLDREEIVRRVRHLEPTWSFRARFGYQNIMYLAAGETAEEIAGASWDELIDRRIFTPLGMTQSGTSIAPLTGMQNVSSPHQKIDGAVVPIAWRGIDNIAPAGSINSNATDMAQWVRLQLGDGAFAGDRLISERSLREMHSPQTIIESDTAQLRLFPSTHFRLYGLGWFLEDYRGRKLVHHGGNIDGMSALVAMMPEEGVGLVILTNMNGSGLPNALMHHLFDRFLGEPVRDWSADVLAFTQERSARAEAQQRRTLDARVADTRPSLPLERYAGTYAHEMYGEIRVLHEGGALRIDAGPGFTGAIEHWHYDTFRADWEDPVLGRSFLTFALNARGDVSGVDVEGLAAFERRPEPQGGGR